MANCYELGRYFEAGTEDRPPDPTRAIARYQRACDAGHAAACLALGELYSSSPGADRDSAGAEESYRRGRNLMDEACMQDGDYEVCSTLAMLYEYGDMYGAAKDADLALRYHERACDGGLPASCEAAAKAHEGVRAEKLRRRAREGYERLCRAGDMYRCFVLATKLDRSDPAERDRSVALLDTSCTGGEIRACALLGEAYLEGVDHIAGLELERDVERARTYFERGCELEDQSSCTSLKTLEDR